MLFFFFSDLQNQGNNYTAQTLLFRRLFSIMFDIVIRTKMKRKCRTDASWSLCSQKLKVKLRWMQPKFYFVAREWRSRHLVHGPTCHPCGERDLIFKSKDRGRRSKANDGEASASVYQGRGRAVLELGCHSISILFWSTSSSHGYQYVRHLVANMVKSACDETDSLLEVRFVATLVPTGLIWFLLVSSCGFLLLSSDLVVAVL